MLPIMLLQPSDLATFDTALNSADLLPQEASEPSAAFADILNLGVESGEPSDLPLGILLPQAGNELPPPVLPDFDAVSSDVVEGMPIPNPDNLRLEMLPSMPASASAVDSPQRGGPVAVATPMLEPASLPSAPRPILPAMQVSLVPAQVDAQHLAPDTPLPRDGKPLDAAALTPVPQPGPSPQASVGQIARDLAAAPVVGASMAPLLDDAVPGTRKATPVEAVRMPGTMAELSSRQAEPLAPVTLAAGDERPAEIRPLPVTPSTPPALQPQLQPGNTIEVPVGQQAQISPLQPTLAQGAATSDTTAPTVQLTQSIDVPVKDPAWGERIGERVLLMAGNRLQSAEIRLTPAELGPLRIQVAVDDGAANVTFLSQHAVTRDAIEQALPRLRELLAENGLTLNETNVGGHDEQGVHEGNSDNNDDSNSLANGATDSAGEPLAADHAAGPQQLRRPDSLVDTFV